MYSHASISTAAVVAAIALSLAGCRTTKVLSSDKSTTADSVVIVERIRDTVVTVGADSSMMRALLECDSLGQVRLKELLDYRTGQRLQPPAIYIRDNVLTAAAKVDSTAIYMQLKDRLETRSTRHDQTTTITVEVNKLTWWQTLWLTLGKLMTAFAALWIGLSLILRFCKR